MRVKMMTDFVERTGSDTIVDSTSAASPGLQHEDLDPQRYGTLLQIRYIYTYEYKAIYCLLNSLSKRLLFHCLSGVVLLRMFRLFCRHSDATLVLVHEYDT